MATKEEITEIMELIRKNKPQRVFKNLNDREMGLFAVIGYLSESNGEVTSSDISKFLCVSSARIAIMIKKLEKREFIEKIDSSKDKRVKVIKLTQKGHNLSNKLDKHANDVVEKIIDEFGLKELKDFFETMERLKIVLDENAPSDMEDLQ